MVRHATSKRIRANSHEPKRLLDITFENDYVNRLVLALRKMMAITNSGRISSSTTNTTEDDENVERAKIVRFEVDMALALSARGFRWSHALEARLQTNQPSATHEMRISAIFETKVFGALSLPAKREASQNPECDLKLMKKVYSPKRKRPGSRKVQQKRTENDNVDDQLASLRTLLPGGSETEGDEHELLVELASYVTCLKLQVKVLRSLVEGHH